MDLVPPSYQFATTRDAWSVIAEYIPSSDLCAASLVCRKWHALFMPFLWGDPASHFGTDNDAVYVALTRFRRTLKYARLEVRMLTHTLHLPPALSEIYGGPRPEWLREILEYLPCLQSLMVSKLPFIDHNSLVALRHDTDQKQVNETVPHTYNVRLLLADHEPNTTSQGLGEALLRFQELIYLDLSYTTPSRDRSVLSAISQLEHLQVLKLRGIGMKDSDAEFLANAIGLRVRYLDLRDNRLTDMAVRSLLQASFLSPGNPTVGHGPGGTIAPNFVAQATPPPSNSKLLSYPTLDEQFMKALTQPLTGRSWVENVPHVGITHIYIADNRITVEGAASLLASYRLHALDVGTVDTADSIRDQRVITSYHRDPRKLPGAEKLIPILGSSAKESLTYLRAHHAVCTADAQWKDTVFPDGFLSELPAENERTEDQTHELDAANIIHELPADEAPIFELPGSIPEISRKECQRLGQSAQLPVREDEQLPERRRGSVFAPEVVETTQGRADDIVVPTTTRPVYPAKTYEGLIPTESEFIGNSEAPGTNPIYASPISMDDPKGQKIQELLCKRPKKPTLPRKDNKENTFPYLHPSHVPHLETLVLTDVPSHVPVNSPILRSLIRFITDCSNEALLAILQAGSDYSLPPGRARAKAEQERSRSLFALRRLVLEVTPVEKTIAKLTAWKSLSYQQGASKSSTGDRDSEKLWAAAADDFSFFGEDECGVPEQGPGRYFPMAVLNEKVILNPDDDSGNSEDSTPVAPVPKVHRPNFSSSHGRRLRSDSINSGLVQENGGVVLPQTDAPEVDLVAELAAFRRLKKAEYEDLLRRARKRRSTNGTTSLLSPSGSLSSFGPLCPSPSLSSLAAVSAPQLALSHYVEGYWKGEVKIVRNPAPKGRSGVVDMYGNYFEKGYLYP
ncbi:hypothetical protein ETB97_008812 [Aspergillus alliaceus]|uniref:F-box domain-containing protein n=1 Tax=Petromyces alliaceus TaxID=209559 RepID=A0A8H6E936_PETAA|nr:hypothetical protein ETB97_008812 [Aspergillus burnettii]